MGQGVKAESARLCETQNGGRWRTHSQHVTHQEQRDAPNCKQRQCATRDAQHSTCNTQRANHKARNAARNWKRRKVQNAAAHYKQKHHRHKHHQHKQQNSPWDGFRVSEPVPVPPPSPLLLSSQITTPRGQSQGVSSLPRNLAYMHSAIARCIACCSPSSPPAPFVPPHDTHCPHDGVGQQPAVPHHCWLKK